MMRARTLILLLAFDVALGCAGGEPNPPPKEATLVIANKSQFVLDEVRVHSGASFLDVPRLNAAPLAIGQAVTTTVSEDVNVTVIRVRYQGGPPVAISTEEPLMVSGGGIFDVSVFDESFRSEARGSSTF